MTLTSGSASSSNGMSLMNKLITLTSEGKYSLIDTVVEKLGAKKPSKSSNKEEEKKKEEKPVDSWADVVSKSK